MALIEKILTHAGPRLFGAALAGLLLASSFDKSFASSPACSVEMLDRFHSAREIGIPNSGSIYSSIADLLEQKGAIEGNVTPDSRKYANIAWIVGSDSRPDQITFPKDMSMLNMILMAAHLNGESVFDRRNYLLVAPRRATILDQPRINPFETQTENDRFLITVMPSCIRILKSDAALLEQAVDAQLRETERITGRKSPVFRINGKAREAVIGLNIIGRWSYGEFLQAIQSLTGLDWGMSGGVLWLGTPDTPEGK